MKTVINKIIAIREYIWERSWTYHVTHNIDWGDK